MVIDKYNAIPVLHVLYSIGLVKFAFYALFTDDTLLPLGCVVRSITMFIDVIVYMGISMFNPFRSYLAKKDENTLILWDLNMAGMMLLPIAELRYFEQWINILLICGAGVFWMSSCGYLLIKHYKNYELTIKR